jgi:hypothetical protein
MNLAPTRVSESGSAASFHHQVVRHSHRHPDNGDVSGRSGRKHEVTAPALAVRRPLLLRSIEDPAGGHSECLSQPLDHHDSRVARPALDVADVGAMNTSAVGIVLLAPAFRLAQLAEVAGEALSDIHSQWQPQCR